ncbi:P-loop ATPase, Sll1717 family [Algoriphagus namhaensis]
MTKKEILENTSFGESIAEQEADKLKDYFFQTDFWRSVRSGKNDIVYGAKGAGKSAIYMSLVNDIDSLFDESILVSLAENPQGNTAFSNLTNDPPTSETEFIRLWKLYFLVITSRVLEEYEIKDKSASKIRQILTDCNLVPAQNKLASFLKVCYDFMKSFRNGKEVSTTAEFDSMTGMYSGQKFSLSFGEPSKSDFDKGLIPIEHAFDLLEKSLAENKIDLWIIIDRLDVAFLESEELEANALRALFKAYLDLAQYKSIKIKIFLRDDIWQKITSEGFREASHITKYQNLSWSKDTLLNLLIRRLLDNEVLTNEYNLDKKKILGSIEEQEALFYLLFPGQVDLGAKKPTTLDWALSRTKDGKGINTPRELIQLFTHARTRELKKLETGINNLENDQIISRQSLKEAIEDVSKQRMEQTIYAEFPQFKDYIEKLRDDKADHILETLSKKWAITILEAEQIAKELEKIGFFEQKGTISSPKYRIPFMYRPYLDILQGSATI